MDWADEKAREWLEKQRLKASYYKTSLAALLREVKSVRADLERVRLLAEVRRVVLMVKAETDRPGLCDEILSRMEIL